LQKPKGKIGRVKQWGHRPKKGRDYNGGKKNPEEQRWEGLPFNHLKGAKKGQKARKKKKKADGFKGAPRGKKRGHLGGR